MDRSANVLQYIAMEGVAETESIVADTEGSESELVETLEDLEERGLVEGDGFWYLTDEGEDHLNELLRQRFTADEIDELESQYAEFESHDLEFKELANAWQQANDESEREELIAALAEFHRDVEAFFASFSESIRNEYETYVADLESALQTLRDGNRDFYTGTEVDSYHTVWFRLHDDLLRTLGKQRDE